MTVDNMQIKKVEFDWALSEARGQVLSLCSQAGVSPDSWNGETAIGVPSELAAELAVEQVRRFHAVASLAVERGYWQSQTFDSMVSEQQTFNRLRAEAIAEGQPVTGLASYSLEQYIRYRMDDVRRLYCFDGKNPGMEISPEELQSRYEQDRDIYYTVPGDLELYVLEIQSCPPEQTEPLAQALEQLRTAAVSAGSLEQAAAAFPQLQPFCSRLSIPSDLNGAYAKAHGTLMLLADGLETGEISQVCMEYTQAYLIQCIRRDPDGYRPLDQVLSNVEQAIRRDRYDSLVQTRMEQMNAEYDFDFLKQYAAQQLG